MSETASPPEPSLAEYIRAENAKETAMERGDVPPVESAPVSPSTETTAEATEVPPQASQEPIEPVKAAEPEAERNADGTFKPKEKKVNANTKEWARNQKLTAELRAAQAELERLRTTSQTPTPPQAPQPLDASDPEPTLDQFLDTPDPYAALAVAAGKWAVREERRAQQQIEAQTAQQAAAAEVAAKIDAFVVDHPDYQEKLQTIEDITFPREVLTAIADDDLAPAVAYYLAEHPDEARRIAALTPLSAVKEIGKLSSRVAPAPVGSGTHAVSTSKAKPLIKPVSGSPVAPESRPPEELPFGPRYIREMNAKERREREGLRGA